ncbi:hypothetical protein Slit_2043 [Sideroxydans lithotrophicus ES-1]|uniref:FecR protein domain-containing protein n=2 Tax=Sideroxydans TaxID=314343 RepID=D5CTV9_SIDLE|nr:hypothetical protein Slit_2043 [Sideroxydans lithotrophicus ES-1]
MVCNFAYSAELFGTVDALSGKAYIADQSGKTTVVSVGLKIFEGQTINSGSEGEVHLVTEDGGIIAIRPNSVFRVDEYKAEGDSSDKIFMSLLKGSIRSITGWIGKFNTSAYRLTTPTATIGIRGTDHETTVIDKGDGDEPGTYDNVNEGATVLRTAQGEAEVTPGKYAFAPKGRVIAPFFLARRPHFFAVRRLRIEERIQRRKEILHGRLNQMREDRIRKFRSLHRERLSHIVNQRRSVSGHGQGQVAGRRNDQHRLEQSRSSQVRRMEFERRRGQNLEMFKASSDRRRKFNRGKSGSSEERHDRFERGHRAN